MMGIRRYVTRKGVRRGRGEEVAFRVRGLGGELCVGRARLCDAAWGMRLREVRKQTGRMAVRGTRRISGGVL